MLKVVNQFIIIRKIMCLINEMGYDNSYKITIKRQIVVIIYIAVTV